jgi:DNA-binding SARP family transcriptional activator/tetratricopeptide (TPR) repeat protein
VTIRLSTLGPLELTRSGEPALVRRRKELGLLAYLARRAPRPVPRAALASLLWGGVDETRSRRSLRQALSDLRDVLGPVLVADQETVRLDAGLELDMAEFEIDLAAERWGEAIARCRGPFLEGMEELGDEEWRAWIDAERAGLDAKLLVAYSHAVQRLQASGDREAAIQLATEWTDRFPHDGDAIARLLSMLVGARRGNEARARLAVYGERLRQDLGSEPSADLEALLTQEAIASPAVRGLLTPDLVGRSDDLAALRSAWERVVRGSGVVLVVDGDEGLGKTRLLAEFVRELRSGSSKAAVIDTRAFAAEREAGALARVLIGRLSDAPGSAAVPADSLAVLARVAPELQERFPRLPPGSADTPLEPHFLRLVTEVAAEQPVTIVVDDAPAADQQSQSGLAALVRRPAPGCLLILAGRREEWRGSALSESFGASEVEWLKLRPLSASETKLAIRSMAPFEGAALTELVQVLHRQSSGVPGYLVSMVTTLAESGAIAPGSSGEWEVMRPLDAAPLSSGIRAVMEDRLAGLPAEARTLVEAAAVIGPRVDPRLLEAVTGLAPVAFQDALGVAVGRRLLREDPGGGELHFGSEANREAAYRLLAPSRREALHRMAARALAAGGGPAEVVAEHRRRGGRDPARRGRTVALALGAGAVVVTLVGAGWYSRITAARVAPGTGILLADVANGTGDPIFDQTLSSAALVSLQQSPRVWLVSRSRFPEILARMRRSDTTVDGVLAQEMAIRENLPLVAELGITGIDPAYLLTGRLVDARTGRDLRTFQVRAAGRASVLGGVDRLTRDMRRALGDAPPPLGSRDSLPRVSTGSLEALRAYTDGLRAWGQADWVRARISWLRAVELDSAFALGYISLADFAARIGNQPAEVRRYLAAAQRFADRLTERERLILDYTIARQAGDHAGAITAQRTLAERYPSPVSLYNLGGALMAAGRCADAVPLFERAVAMASGFSAAWINLATCRQALGALEPALEAYRGAERADSMALVRDNINHEWGQVFLKLGRPAAAESAFRRILGNPEPTNQARGHRSLGYLAMFQGRYTDGVAELDRAIALSRGAGVLVTLVRNLIIQANALISAGRPELARVRLDEARALIRAREYEPAYLEYLGAGYVRMGRLADATDILGRLGTRPEAAEPARRAHHRRLEARIAIAAGRPRQALDLLAIAPPPSTTGTALWDVLRGEAYAAIGRIDSAVAAFRTARQIWNWGFEGQEEWVRVPFRIGQLADRVGDVAGARSGYGELVERWRQGDSTLVELVAAREWLGNHR